MFKIKLPISFLLSTILVLFLDGYLSFSDFLRGWLLVFPFLFLYALPVSIMSEIITKRFINQKKRALSSFFIHMGFAVIFYFGNIGFATLACLVAFAFFVLDEITRIFSNKRLFQKSVVITTPFLLLLSLVFWITAFIQTL